MFCILHVFLDEPLQQFHFLRQLGVTAHLAFNLAHRMQHSRMVTPAKTATDLRQRARRHHFGQIHRDLTRL